MKAAIASVKGLAPARYARGPGGGLDLVFRGF